MIIDMHVHLGTRGFCAQGWWEGWTRQVAMLANRPFEKVWNRLPVYWEHDEKVLLDEMDGAGIDMSVLIGTDWGLGRYGDGDITWEEQNKIYASISQKYPDRIISIAGIDPRRKEAVPFLERAIKEWGMKGLKIHPVPGFYPNDRVVYPLYEKALELGIPVFFHTGPILCQQSKYAQPIYCDDVALDFPDLNLILCHGGHWAWWREALGIIAHKPNVYLDLSAWQPFAHVQPLEFYRILRQMLDLGGPRRILFGSDGPFFKLLVPQVEWVKMFKEPPDFVAAAGITFTEEEKNLVLGENFAKLLNLQS